MDDNRIDPDPWVVASLAIAGVAAVAQLCQLGLQWVSRPNVLRSGRRGNSLRILKTQLRNAVGDCIRQVEEIVRMLPRLEGVDIDPLSAPFRFGETPMMLSVMSITEYKTAVNMLATEVGHVADVTLAVAADDEQFAIDAGNALLASFSDIKDRINRFYIEGKPIGDVLGDCLTILREFERIIVRLEEAN